MHMGVFIVYRVSMLAIATIALTASTVFGQRGFIREGMNPPRFAPSTGVPTSAFVFCRLRYTSVRTEPMGLGWRTDYPGADTNLMIRASELTKIRAHFDGPESPTHYVVRLTDDALFGCPFVMASDVGTIGLSTEEASRLGQYLLKGGFLWVDDFWGEAAWSQWSREIAKALPPSQYPILDVVPGDSLYRSVFEVARVPQITNIQFWRQTGGFTTSERGAETGGGAPPCDPGSTRPNHGVDVTQHRHCERVGARG